jgi:hypothetical protein
LCLKIAHAVARKGRISALSDARDGRSRKARGTINFVNFPLGEIQQAAVRRSAKAGGRLSLAVHVALGYVAVTRRH